MTDVSVTEAPDADDAWQQFAYERGWTDGLPVVAPTEDRVAAFVAASGLPADVVVARIPPRSGEASVWRIAANAVMAGCLPEHMPVLVAAVQAVSDPAFNLAAIQATTNPVAPLLVVNGPVRGALGMNAKGNLMGGGNRANAAIGRALRFVLLNIGGGIPGLGDKSTHGQPAKYTFCIAEDEEHSPWAPLSVDLGFQAGQDVVTVIGAQGTTNVWALMDNRFHDMGDHLQIVANAMATIGNSNFAFGRGNPLVLMTAVYARMCVDAGYTKDDVRHELYERSAVDLRPFFAPAVYDQQRGELATSVFPADSMHVVGDRAYCCRRAEDILIVVCGGDEAHHVQYLPNFGDTLACSAAVGDRPPA